MYDKIHYKKKKEKENQKASVSIAGTSQLLHTLPLGDTEVIMQSSAFRECGRFSPRGTLRQIEDSNTE